MLELLPLYCYSLHWFGHCCVGCCTGYCIGRCESLCWIIFPLVIVVDIDWAGCCLFLSKSTTMTHSMRGRYKWDWDMASRLLHWGFGFALFVIDDLMLLSVVVLLITLYFLYFHR